jgi:hypothetical protein
MVGPNRLQQAQHDGPLIFGTGRSGIAVGHAGNVEALTDQRCRILGLFVDNDIRVPAPAQFHQITDHRRRQHGREEMKRAHLAPPSRPFNLLL